MALTQAWHAGGGGRHQLQRMRRRETGNASSQCWGRAGARGGESSESRRAVLERAAVLAVPWCLLSQNAAARQERSGVYFLLPGNRSRVQGSPVHVKARAKGLLAQEDRSRFAIIVDGEPVREGRRVEGDEPSVVLLPPSENEGDVGLQRGTRHTLTLQALTPDGVSRGTGYSQSIRVNVE